MAISILKQLPLVDTEELVYKKRTSKELHNFPALSGKGGFGNKQNLIIVIN